MEASESKVPTILGHEYGKMPDPVTALKCARHIIVEEKRWTTGSLMESPASEGGDGFPAPTCTNVKVCAIGALVLVVGDGPAVDLYFNGEGDDDSDSTEMMVLKDHEVGEPALLALSAATRKIEGEVLKPMSIGIAVNDVESFNDAGNGRDFVSGYGGEEHLNRVISAFDLAIELANSITPEDPPAAA